MHVYVICQSVKTLWQVLEVIYPDTKSMEDRSTESIVKFHADSLSDIIYKLFTKILNLFILED